MRAFLRVASALINTKWHLPFRNWVSTRGCSLRQGLFLRRRQAWRHPILERLEDRLTPSAIFVAEPDGSLTYLSPTDIGAAFAGILRASGRSTVVTEQVRRGVNDATANGAVIDAGFTPTGLVTLEPIATGGFIQHAVTVSQLANYFGFDHF